jgi:hypothetical protein
MRRGGLRKPAAASPSSLILKCSKANVAAFGSSTNNDHQYGDTLVLKYREGLEDDKEMGEKSCMSILKENRETHADVCDFCRVVNPQSLWLSLLYATKNLLLHISV